MFSVSLLRRFRPCVVSTSLRHTLVTAAPLGPPGCGAFIGGVSRSRLHVVGRSFLGTNNKVQSLSSLGRSFSAQTPSEDGRLVYTGSLGTAVRGVKIFSYSTSSASLILLPQILLKTGLGVQSLALQAAFCGIMGFFTFLTPVLLHYFTKGYVLRLYHKPEEDTYTAVTYSVILTEKRHTFHQGQVRVPEISKMFTTFYAGETGLLVNPDLFTMPVDYNHLMGYDKPFRFDCDDLDSPDKS